ncbi:MAG: OsmC family protein [Desulfobacterales bacterium]
MDMAHYYEVKAKWKQGKEGELTEPTLPTLHTGTAPPFPGAVANVWAPEHLFVAAINGCLMTTFFAIAENSRLAFDFYECRARGKLEKVEGLYMISEVVLQPLVKVTFEKDIDRAERIIQKSEHMCLISNSVKTKIILKPEIVS